nr:hypothetical protein [Mycoplasmopsis cynos]
MVQEVISNGKALEKFYEFISLQGGDVEKLKSDDFWVPKYRVLVESQQEGYLEIFDSLTFGLVSMKLGAGRQKKEDVLDFEAGITLNKKTNDYVKTGDILFTLYSSKPIDVNLLAELKQAYRFNQAPVENKIILQKLQ